MKLKAEQLQRHLKTDPGLLYWLAGDEPLLLQEAADSIRLHCRDNDFLEREIFDVDRSFNWERFSQATGNLSLFAERKIFELRLSSAKVDDAGKTAIQDFIDAANPDFLLLITGPKLEPSTLNSKWFKRIESSGALVQIWPINADGLPRWLDQRLQEQGIRPTPGALTLLCNKIEGNLLAAMQEIEKLKLLANNDANEVINLDEKTVLQLVADSSRYTAYTLIDAALLGDAVRALKILQGLREEGAQPIVIVGALAWEFRSLLPMLDQVRAGQPVQAVIQSNRVWFNRKQAVSGALRRLSPELVWSLFASLRTIDQSIKGMSQANSWDELSGVILRLCGTTTALSA